MAKGRALGVLPAPSASSAEGVRERPAAAGAVEDVVRIAGQTIRLVPTPSGLRAADMSASSRRSAAGLAAIDPSKVEAYLRSSFKDDLDTVEGVMKKTARAHGEEDLRKNAMHLYERFRPAWAGWGVKGKLHLSGIRAASR